MLALHTFPSSSQLLTLLRSASLLLGSSLQLRSVHPTAFLLTFRLASDAVILLFSLRFSHDFLWNTYFYI